MSFVGYLAVNTFSTMFTAVLIYFFLKLNFMPASKKNDLLLLVLSFGLINGIVASLWTNLFDIPASLNTFKQILLTVLSVVIIKFVVRVNWLKSILAFFVVMLGLGLGSACVPVILKLTPEEALLNVVEYIKANIVICIIALLFAVIVHVLIRSIGSILKKSKG